MMSTIALLSLTAAAGPLDGCTTEDAPDIRCGPALVRLFDTDLGDIARAVMPSDADHAVSAVLDDVLNRVIERSGHFWLAGFADTDAGNVRLWRVKTYDRHNAIQERGWAALRHPGTEGHASICLAPHGKRPPVYVAPNAAQQEDIAARELRMRNREAFHRCRERVAELAVTQVAAR